MTTSSGSDSAAVDFRRPAPLGPDQTRALRSVHDELCDRLSPMLTTRLRNPLRLTVRSMEMVAGAELQDAENPSVVAICELAPFPTPCALRIPLTTALVVIDILLGGNGTVADSSRNPTEVELQILRRLLDHCTGPLDGAWAGLAGVTSRIGDVGTDVELLDQLPLDEPFLRVELDMELDGAAHDLEIWMPNSALAGAVRGIESIVAAAPSPAVRATQTRVALCAALSEVSVEATVAFREVPMSPAAILSLNPGDLIRLGPTDQTLALRVGTVELGAVRPARNGTRTACQVVSTFI